MPYLILVVKEGVNTSPRSNIPNFYTFVRWAILKKGTLVSEKFSDWFEVGKNLIKNPTLLHSAYLEAPMVPGYTSGHPGPQKVAKDVGITGWLSPLTEQLFPWTSDLPGLHIKCSHQESRMRVLYPDGREARESFKIKVLRGFCKPLCNAIKPSISCFSTVLAILGLNNIGVSKHNILRTDFHIWSYYCNTGIP